MLYSVDARGADAVAAPACADAIRSAICERARALGFDAVGFAAPDLPRDRQSAYRRFSPWAATATWLGWRASRSAGRARRASGRRSNSVVVLGINYGPDEDPLAALARRERATISVYARHRDYHDLIKGRLKQLAGWMHARFGAQVKVFVDTAPMLEKPLAQRAGIGWQGKHTNLVSRRFGSWLFLGEIFTDLELEPDPAEDRSLRQLPRLPGRLPDRRVPRALPARRPALHLLPHDRAPGAHPARVPRADGQSHLRLRRLSRGLPVEQVRARGQRSQAAGARRSAGAAARRARPAR